MYYGDYMLICASKCMNNPFFKTNYNCLKLYKKLKDDEKMSKRCNALCIIYKYLSFSP